MEIAGPSCVTIGKFDGLHAGHRRLLRAMRELGLPRIMVSVEVPQAKELLSPEESAIAAEAAGIDCRIRMPLTDDTKNRTAESFAEEVLLRQLHAEAVVVGENFRFGRDRGGDALSLRRMLGERGVRCIVCPMVTDEGETVSSTRLRSLLESGDIPTLNRLLGCAYPVHGIVRHGRHLGRTIHYPTVNLCPSESKLLPPFGVYRTRIRVGSETYDAVTNVGDNPTVRDGSEHAVTVETHIPGFERELYGETVTVSFYRAIRPQRTFASLRELTLQLAKDAGEVKKPVQNVQDFPCFDEN